MTRFLPCLTVAMLTALQPTASQAAPHTRVSHSRVYEPRPNSAERKAILNALRIPLSKTLKRKVIFHVHSLKVSQGWAFASVTALRADGSRPGNEDLWGEAQGLLRKKGRRWRVLVHGLATDTSVYDEAKRKYPKAPRAIFNS